MCHFNKIIKVSVTSFQSPALSQKHVRKVCCTSHYYLTKFHFDSTQDTREISINVTSITTSQIFKSMDFREIQISRYLENKTFLLQIKNSLITNQGLLYT